MVAVWLFLGFLVLVGLMLIVAGSLWEQQREQQRTAYVQAVHELHELRSTLTAVEREARAQLAAGDPNFVYLLTLLEPQQKELS